MQNASANTPLIMRASASVRGLGYSSQAAAALHQHPVAAWAKWTSASGTVRRINKLDAVGDVWRPKSPPDMPLHCSCSTVKAQVHSVIHTSIWACFLCLFYNSNYMSSLIQKTFSFNTYLYTPCNPWDHMHTATVTISSRKLWVHLSSHKSWMVVGLFEKKSC